MRGMGATRSRRSRLAAKRAIDVLGAAGAGLVLSPVLAWVALAVAATEGLPILFRQQWPGLGGKPFTTSSSGRCAHRAMTKSGI